MWLRQHLFARPLPVYTRVLARYDAKLIPYVLIPSPLGLPSRPGSSCDLVTMTAGNWLRLNCRDRISR